MENDPSLWAWALFISQSTVCVFSLSPCAVAISLQADKHFTYEKRKDIVGLVQPPLDMEAL